MRCSAVSVGSIDSIGATGLTDSGKAANRASVGAAAALPVGAAATADGAGWGVGCAVAMGVV